MELLSILAVVQWVVLVLAVLFLLIAATNVWYTRRIYRTMDPNPGPAWLERLMRW